MSTGWAGEFDRCVEKRVREQEKGGGGAVSCFGQELAKQRRQQQRMRVGGPFGLPFRAGPAPALPAAYSGAHIANRIPS